jgi:hypothetical protein
MSSIAISSARRSGWKKGRIVTAVPMRMREVRAARCAAVRWIDGPIP